MPSSMELFGALLQGQKPARVPLTVNLLDQGAMELNMGMEEYYSKAENVFRGQMALRKKYQHDLVWGFHYTARIAEMLGSKRTIYPQTGASNVGDLVIKKWDDIESLTLPDSIEECPAFQIQAETIRLLNAELAGSCPVCAAIVGSFSMPSLLMGIDKWLELLLEGPLDLRQELLRKCSDFTGMLCKAFFGAGATMIAYSNAVATVDFFSVQQLRQMALPWIQRDAKLHGTQGLVYFNGGGRINPIIDMLIAEAGFGAIYINPLDDVAEARQIIGGRGILAASINDILLIGQKPDQVRAEVKRIFEAGGAEHGGFIFGSLVMPTAIPDENIHALVSAGREFG